MLRREASGKSETLIDWQRTLLVATEIVAKEIENVKGMARQ